MLSSDRILDRHQYRSCHIRVPDQEQRLAAIEVDGKYYSFFKTAKDQAQAVEVVARLARRQDTSLITRTAKGYALWIYEPDATATMPTGSSGPDSANSTYRILESRQDYRSCHIQVPDLDRPLAAVLVDGQYYSLFKVARERQQAIELANRLGKKGTLTVITRVAQGEAVWVLESEATPESPTNV